MIGPCWSSFGHLVKIVGVSWNCLKRSIMKAERDLYFSASDQRVIRGDMSLRKIYGAVCLMMRVLYYGARE